MKFAGLTLLKEILSLWFLGLAVLAALGQDKPAVRELVDKAVEVSQ